MEANRLRCVRISSYQNKNGEVVISAPMSPMLAVNDFVTQVFGKGTMPITAIYRIISNDNKDFSTWRNADIAPVHPDVLAVVMDFRNVCVFCEIGSGYLPVVVNLGDGYVFCDAYREEKFIQIPADTDITDALDNIQYEKLIEEYNVILWEATLDKVNDWFSGLSLEKLAKVFPEYKPCDVLKMWNDMALADRVSIYEQWNGKL